MDYHDLLKMKVMHDNPSTFQGAVTTAVNEQNLCSRFNLCSTSSPTIQEEEPMEMGHARPKKYHKLGHIVKHCRSSHQSKSHVNTVSEQQHSGTIDPETKITNNPDCVLNVTAQTIFKGTSHNLRPRVTNQKTRLLSSG